MRAKFQTNTVLKSLLLGAAAGGLFFLAVSLVTALILTKSDLPYSAIKCVCFAVTAVAGFMAGYIGRRGVRMKGILAGAISSLPLSVLIVAAVLAVNGFICGEEVFLLLPVGVFFGMLGGIVSSNLR